MLKKFFELVGMATTGYVGYLCYKEYKKSKTGAVFTAEEEETEDPSVEVDDFFAEDLTAIE